MRDTASATEEVQQNCARTRTTETREIRVALEADQRRAHRAPARITHRTSPIQLSAPPDPPHARLASASQRPSFGFLPSLSFRSTPPRPIHRPASLSPVLIAF